MSRGTAYVQVRQDREETTEGKPLDPAGLAREIDCSEGQCQILLLVSFCTKLWTDLRCPNYHVIAAWTMVNKLQQHCNALCKGRAVSDVIQLAEGCSSSEGGYTGQPVEETRVGYQELCSLLLQ